MDVGIATFRLLALSQIVLFAAVVLSSCTPWLRRSLLLLLSLTIGAYLVVPLAAAGGWPMSLRAGIAILATLCPLALLLVVLDLFEERAFDVGVTVLALSCTALAVAQVVATGGPFGPAIMTAMHIVKLGLVGLTGILLWRGRRSDLVELRLRLRGGLVLVIGSVALVVLGLEWAFAWQVPVQVELPGMAAIFLLALIVNLTFWRLDPGLSIAAGQRAEPAHGRPYSGPPAPAQPVILTGTISPALAMTADLEPAPISRDGDGAASPDPLLGRIDALMRAERLHADHDLRIATLAARLGVPEYRVRRAINAGLGFRNFNHYVNSFRIDEASRRLRSERHLPVLSIALDVGFRSMSSFNVAFRERHDCTPGEFRAAVAPDA